MLANGTKDTVRQAGIGGIKINERYLLPNLKISLGGLTAQIPEIDIKTTPEPASEGEGVLGLRTLMLYPQIHLNFTDFTLTPALTKK
ncbi:MAG: hypothetical protein HDR81_05005 [Bacteroides sp.]|nr:hypothetical protein [Bacteroides sp.]